ncbi:MAG: hypothetical protein NTX59_09530 [Elusimicrobia bacterium]|nr:hypothetical protein [Elusimicrobiota bacterium]
MPKLTFLLKVLGCIAAVLAAVLVLILGVSVISSMFSPLYQARQLNGGGKGLDKALRRDEICANLLKGDFAAASKPIARKTVTREFRIADTITWLAKKGGTPFVEIPRSQLFTELPSDQGPLQSCRPQGAVTLTGDQLYTSIYLGYRKSRLSVTLRYSTGWFSPTLERIEIAKPEPVVPDMPPPDATDQKMSQFIKKLDQGY